MDHTHVVMQLLFENTQFTSSVNSVATSDLNLQKNTLSIPIRSEIFFELFPFHVVFKRNLEIVSIGESLRQAMKNVERETFTDVFNLIRPLMSFNWQNVSISHFYSKQIFDPKNNFKDYGPHQQRV
jgi:guanylate cyclase